jgi:hypothetical protein
MRMQEGAVASDGVHQQRLGGHARRPDRLVP